MRKTLLILLTGLVMTLGSLATTNASTLPYIGHAKSNLKMTPIENAACRGWGYRCAPGYTRSCHNGRCWCRPC